MSGQEDIAAFLQDPATFGGADVQRIDTHISSVFLVGDLAFKMKRARKLPFVDFSTLAQRRAACEAEMRLNSRTAPGIYQGITAVTRQDGGLALDGDGEAVEYLVRMRRFDQEDMFDHLAERGDVGDSLLEQLVEDVARFHQNAEIRRDQGGGHGMDWTIESIKGGYSVLKPGILPQADLARHLDGVRQELARLYPLLEQRRADGYVRQCHGDLHLGNICLFEGRPTLFDAVEFEDRISCIDVFYDLAYLIMDLDQRGMTRAANRVLNLWIERTADRGALAALPLFLSCRAAIRAHIRANIAGEQGGVHAGLARHYMDLALACLHPPKPRLLALGGLSGSGKSRAAREAAGRIGAVVLRSDVLRKQIWGCDLHQRLPEAAYAPEVTRQAYDALYREAKAALRAGQSVIADAVFARPEERAAIAEIAAGLDLRFDGAWLQTSFDEAARRIEGRGRNASDATVEILRRQMQYDLGAMDWRIVDSSGPVSETDRMVADAFGLD